MNEYLTAEDVMSILRIARPTAAKIIQRLNRELREQGYLTVSGRVSKAYFKERYK
jgi:hypothetical protein